jgi:hypothetical protein
MYSIKAQRLRPGHFAENLTFSLMPVDRSNLSAFCSGFGERFSSVEQSGGKQAAKKRQKKGQREFGIVGGEFTLPPIPDVAAATAASGDFPLLQAQSPRVSLVMEEPGKVQ